MRTLRNRTFPQACELHRTAGYFMIFTIMTMEVNLPLKDCLRIGRIFVDVQVTQQYKFEVSECDTK